MLTRPGAGWPLERILFTMAETVTVASAALAATVSRRFVWLGANRGL